MAIKERLRNLTNKSSTSRYDDELLLSKEVLRRIIDRERDRANRTGEIFSLVVLVLPDLKDVKDPLASLVDTLARRMRSIDAVGWLDAKHIGILLPETESQGAHMFVEKIYEEVQCKAVFSNYEVFTYPSAILTDPENIAVYRMAVHEYKHASHWDASALPWAHKKVDYIFCLTKKILKRGFDIAAASLLLLFLSPLFLFIAIIIKSVSKGPVFFKQQRVGYGGHPFTFLKFRTMCSGADNSDHQEYLATLIKGASDLAEDDTPMVKIDHGPQIIPFGNILRKSCLDELPQLINVLRGEMSLVGPRPPIPYEVKEYSSWHRGRFNAMPGMTGLWQVSGKNNLSFREMVRLDIRYAKERSLLMDIKILFRTPTAILEQIRDSLNRKRTTINEGV